MALNTIDLRNLIEPFQRNGIFKGVFPCDMLPKIDSFPAGFIINLSDHTSIGSHWVGLFIDRHGVAEYFDSFGFPPRQRDIVRFIKKNSKNMLFNERQIQHIVSNKCGKFVVLFILCKLYNKSVPEIIAKFSTNLKVNDILIENCFNYFKQLRKNILYSM